MLRYVLLLPLIHFLDYVIQQYLPLPTHFRYTLRSRFRPNSSPVVCDNLFEPIVEGLVAWFLDLVEAPLGR